MDIDLDELERLSAQITPLPWKNEPDENFFDHDCQIVRSDTAFVCEFATEANAAYIVAACNAVPELISMYRKAKDEANDADTAYQMVNRDNVDLTRHILELREKVRELERQREFFLRVLNNNRLCPNGGCFHDGSDLDEWDCTSYDNRECWIQAAKETGE